MRNQLRIIGGQWRGRKLQFTSQKDLRPTNDRLRETLFNWLQNDIDHAHCLDAFAGTGILGIEALSRNARSVIFCERTRKTAHNLEHQLKTLPLTDYQSYQVLLGNALSHIANMAQAFDIIFLDPPFNQSCKLLSQCLQIIEQYSLLKPQGVIYLEMPSQVNLTDVAPPSLGSSHKQTNQGQVAAYLLRPLAN